MNIKGFLRQTVAWQQKTGENEWGNAAYASPVVLPARVEKKQNMVRSPGGTEILATTRVMLIQEVDIGDTLDGQEVQARENLVDIQGRVLGWVAFL